MKYLSIEVCQALHKLGVKTDTVQINSETQEVTPQYSLPLLITDSEAMKLVFPGKQIVCELCGEKITNGRFCVQHPDEAGYVYEYEYQAHQLLDLCLSGDYEAAEQLLVEALTNQQGDKS